MAMITASQLFDICEFDLMHSYVNVRHQYYKRGLGAQMAGMHSAFYAILVCSRREMTAFEPRLTELAVPSVVCRYMNDVYLAVAYQDNEQLEKATDLVMYIASEDTGYPCPLNLEPDGTQRFLELTVTTVGSRILISFYNKVARDWKQDEIIIQMRLPRPYSTVTSQQKVDRIKGTVQRMLDSGAREN